MMRICFEVPGEPQGKARPRILRNGRAYTPKKTADYEKAIRKAYQKAGGQLTELPVRVMIFANYSIPKSTTKAKRARMLSGELRPTKKPDLDNIAKAVCDALNGVAYKDDAQVCTLVVEKHYKAEPSVHVILGEMIE